MCVQKLPETDKKICLAGLTEIEEHAFSAGSTDDELFNRLNIPPDEGGLERSALWEGRQRAVWLNCYTKIRDRVIDTAAEFHVTPESLQKAADSKKKKAVIALNTARIACSKALAAKKMFCYCEAKETDKRPMLGCDRKRMCPFRGWLHVECAEWLGSVPDDGEPYWCYWCTKFGALFEKTDGD